MANYIVSYDLNGNVPTHAAMDEHMDSAGWSRARILETVWYVGTSQTRNQVFAHIAAILSRNDQIIVAEAKDATFRDLLVADQDFVNAWNAHR